MTLRGSKIRYFHYQISQIALTELNQQLQKHQVESKQIISTHPCRMVLAGRHDATDLQYSLLLFSCERRACTQVNPNLISRRMDRKPGKRKQGIFKTD